MEALSEKFIDSLKKLPGVDSEALVRALDTPPCISLRLNRRKRMVLTEFPSMKPVEWCTDGFYLSERPKFTLDPALHAGAYYVQDASSMIYQQIVEKIIGEKERLTVLDFCAAPGGKTTAVINAVPDGTTVVANEYVASRGKILRENLEKWGYPYVITTGSSSSQYASLPALFDLIAVDAPCSGEGMMRKDEEARRQWNESLVENCSRLQREILSDLIGCLKPGGYLLYSTCTFNIEEDEKNSLFLTEKLGLEPVEIDSLSLTGIEKAGRAVADGVEALRFMPHLTDGEGLYVSIFRKPQDPDAPATESLTEKKSRKKGKRPEKNGPVLTEAMKAELKALTDPSIPLKFEISGSLVTAVPESSSEIVETLRQNGINVTGAGLPIAELKGRAPKLEIIPDSRFALNHAINSEAFASVDLSHEDALRFLRRESFPLGENIPKGYVVVKYKGMPLGMMKNLGNRANNLFPSAWRIKI